MSPGNNPCPYKYGPLFLPIAVIPLLLQCLLRWKDFALDTRPRAYYHGPPPWPHINVYKEGSVYNIILPGPRYL